MADRAPLSTWCRDGRGAPAVAALLAALLAAVAYRHFLLLDRTLIFTDIGSDTVNYYYPFWSHLADLLRRGELPGWSFRMGLGQDTFPDALGRPLDDLMLLLGRNALPYAIAYLEVVKIVLAAGLFCAYLRSLRLAAGAAVAGGLLYGFSGFMVLGGSWYTFSTEGLYLALLLLAFERYFQRGRWGLLVLAFFLIAAGRPFNLMSNGLLLALYGSLRHLDRHLEAGDWSVARHLGFLARLTGLGVVGAALSGVFLLPALHEMAGSQRASGAPGAAVRAALLGRGVLDPADGLQLKTAALRLFSNDLLGRGDDFSGWMEYLEAPLFYVGLPALLLAPQAFVGIGRRRGAMLGGAAALGLALVLFPFLRDALWLYAADYYRIVGFLIALVPLFCAAAALSRVLRGGPVYLPLLGATLAGLLALLYLPDLLVPEGSVDGPLRAVVTAFLLAYAGALALAARPRWRLPALGAAGLLLGAEVLLIATPAATARPVLTAADLAAKTGYNDYAADAAAWMRKTDPGFYRAEKTFSSTPSRYPMYRNDALIQGYRSTSEYHRFASRSYMRFLYAVGATEMLARSEYRTLIGVARRVTLHPFLGVRYLMTGFPDAAALAGWGLGAPPGLVQAMYTRAARFGDVVVYRNRLALPLGFTLDRYLDASKFASLTREGREQALYYAFVPDPGDRAAIDGIPPLGADRVAVPLAEMIAARARSGLALDRIGPNHLTGTVSVEGRALLLLTIPRDPGWSARVDGAPAVLHPVDYGFMGLALGPGKHRIALTFRSPGLVAGGWLSAGGAVALAGMAVAGRRRRKAEEGAPGPAPRA